MTRPALTLSDDLLSVCGEDPVLCAGVISWLTQVCDEASVEIDDVVYEPSLGWLVQTLRKK